MVLDNKEMTAQFFIYTRGYSVENDYKLMYSPSSDFCPDDVRQYFRQQVRGAINIETYEGDLSSPRWLFSRYQGFVLWGIAIMNNVLSDENTEDYTGRGVRGFFGMLLKDGTFEALPLGIQYFKTIYKTLVAPLWFASKEDFKKKGIAVPDLGEHEEVITANDTLSASINTNTEKTIIWGEEHSFNDLLGAAMFVNNNVSIISGLNEAAHAYDHSYYYMNAFVRGIHTTEEKKYKIPTETVQHQKKETDSKGVTIIPEMPKKDYRLKNSLLRAIVIIMTIAVVSMCIRGIKKSKNLNSSGDKATIEQSMTNPQVLEDSLEKKSSRRK